MTKGQQIRELIGKGASDEVIVQLVSTTINSVRWHRSKMKKGAPASVARSGDERTPLGVALEQRGLVQRVLEGLEALQLSHEKSMAIYKQLAEGWTMVISDRATGRYGQCRYDVREVEVHRALVGLEVDFQQTLLHEVAHALDKLVFGRSSGHGEKWKRVMRALGEEPMRVGGHTAEASEALRQVRASKAREIWACDCCGYEAPIARKRKHPPHMYTHRNCGGRFRLKA